MSVVAEDWKARQRMQALENANEVRSGMTEIRCELAHERITLADALVDDRARAMTVYQVLIAQRRWGRTRVRKTLRRTRLSESKRVRELTDRQCAMLVAEAAGS